MLGDLVAQRIGCRLEAPPEREDDDTHQRPRPVGREIIDRAADRFLEAVKSILSRKRHDMVIAGRTPVIVVTFQRGGEHVKLRQRVGHAAGDLLLGLEAAAEQRDGQVGDEGEGPAGAGELAIPVAMRCA